MINQLPEHCLSCHYLIDKMGSCQYPGTTLVDVIISTLPYMAILVFLPIMFIIRRKLTYIGAEIILCSSYIFADRVLKNIIKDPRPFGACKLTYGFPSSHMVVTGAIASLLFNRSILLGVIVSFLQGYSRFVLKYHTIPQIIAGWAFGIIYGLISIKLLTILYNSYGAKIVSKLKFIIDDMKEKKVETELKEE